MKKQLLGIFLGLSMLEGASVLYAAKRPVVHFDDEEYVNYEDLEEKDDIPSFRPIKRPKALPADESAIKKQLKSQLSDVFRSFSEQVKGQPIVSHSFKEALHKIKYGLSDNVNDVGFYARSRSPEQKQQLIDKLNQGYKGDVFGTRSEQRDTPIQNNQDVLDKDRSLSADKSNVSVHDNIKIEESLSNDKAKSAGNSILDEVKGTFQGGKKAIEGVFEKGRRGVEEIYNKGIDFINKGKEGIREVGKRANNVMNALKGQNSDGDINLLDDVSMKQSRNNSPKIENNKEVVQEENWKDSWKDILEGMLHRKTTLKNKAKSAIDALNQELKNSEERPSHEEIKNFVKVLMDGNHITPNIYNDFIKQFDNLEYVKENNRSPAYNTRSRKNK